MKNKTLLIITILFLSIGFAAVSTTLILNGTINVGTNQEDFDVYFSNAIIDGTEDLSLISQDKKTINFETKDLINIGDKSILEYEVTNASTQYDANVSVTCTPSETDLYKIINTQDKEIIEARSIGYGTVTVELKKNVVDEQKINFTCTIKASAGEKETADLGPIKGKCEHPVGTEWTFASVGKQDFIIPCDGEYKLEAWGASGGNTTLTGFTGSGGNGGYTSGLINLEKEKTLYVHVGGKGENGLNSRAGVMINGGYNGGGNNRGVDAASSAGGGATDIRILDGVWNNYESLKSRIMVAGAGGGSGIRNIGAPGGLNGGVIASLYGANGSQTAGGRAGTGYTHNSGATAGGFGIAGNSGSFVTGAGGSGYYGGGGGNHVTPSTSGGGGGGSSFVSGHPGCDSINANGTHTGQPNHYSGLVFTNTQMIPGNASMPTHDGNGTMVGNQGNGYAKITYLG